ncbi:SRC kinase signaling inhibitor 1 [Saguinus oedipus]|uniref:SRC kinase signaling inhibitor 1 n=1 Tax=Saguinus oedipus TaxID=9490 RepID=A0ABQ9VQY4_SAGOE|nr:SRC kinase signaling inhibitor 1 [Saguinus oedipus]
MGTGNPMTTRPDLVPHTATELPTFSWDEGETEGRGLALTRSSRHTQGAQPGLADQAAKLSYASAESLETMSEAELPLGFSRMNRFRQSLPLSRSASQTKLRSPVVALRGWRRPGAPASSMRGAWVHLHSGAESGLRPCLCGAGAAPHSSRRPPGGRSGDGGGSDSEGGVSFAGVLFLQFGEETRRVHITHEVSSLDTLHALIAHMFPQKLTMGMLKSPNTAILIKDEARNVFYELEDVRDIQDRSIIKIYRKEPLYAAFPGSHLTNGDLRREMVYASRESSPTRRLNNLSPAPHLASGSPPPGLPSGSPSRSRLSYAGGRPPSYAGSPVHHAAERLGGAPATQGVSPSPSAILERRDVKPDEDLAGKAGGMVLVKGEGLYADPYGLLHEGRLSLAAAAGDPFAYPGAGGLYKRGSVRSLSTYSAAALQSDLEDSLYKAAGGGGPLYGDGYGFRLPPSSPQKLADVAAPPGGPPPPHSPYSGPPSRGSPVRQSFRKDSGSSVFAESPGGKTRSTGSASTAGAPPSELFPGPGERPLVGFGPPVPAKDTETRERMEAMEKQIASLTGLVQSALLRGSEPETPSEKIEGSNGAATPSATCGSGGRSSGATPVSGPPPPSAGSTPAGQPTAVSRLQMQLHLRGLQNSASDLRGQLQQLRKLQPQSPTEPPPSSVSLGAIPVPSCPASLSCSENPSPKSPQLLPPEPRQPPPPCLADGPTYQELGIAVSAPQAGPGPVSPLTLPFAIPPLRCCPRRSQAAASSAEPRPAALGSPLPAFSRPFPCRAPPLPPPGSIRPCVPQLQNQESVRALLKRTETELSMRVSEAARRQEDPLQRQRTLVEEERLRYLNDEELITQQLK